MEYRGRDRDISRHRHHHHHHHCGEHHGYHDHNGWSAKKVKFIRSRSSPPPPLPDIKYGMQRLSLDDRVLPYGCYRSHQDDEYATWDKPVVFAPEEASYRPKQWLEKLEKLEAQIVSRSAQPGPSLRDAIPGSHTLEIQRAELHSLRTVLSGTRENLRALQRAHFCSQSINMLVLEKGRNEVARLVNMTMVVIQRFIGYAINFIDRDNIVDLGLAGSFLGYCADILAWMELRPRVLQQFRIETKDSLRSSDYYERTWSRGIVTSALVHALRALAYTLDIAVVSFCGAHLEPFDEVYFRHHNDHYHRRAYHKIPCDEYSTSSILIYPRRFDCLSGFLGGNPAWVFQAYERGQILDFSRLLYLRTSPEQLANVWGPVWRAETVQREGASRFMLSKGFLIGWHHSAAVDPPLYDGEYLCHWTDDPLLVSEGSSAGLPRYLNINYLLIGAHPDLEVNKHCPTSAGEVYHDLQEHHYLTNVGTHFAKWYLGPFNIPISVDPPGGSLGYGTELVFKRRQGITCRDTVCSKLVAQPWKHLSLLADLYGVEISGCTGNARRRRLLDAILTRTMREFVGCQLPWVLDYDKWHYFRSLLLHSSTRPDSPYISKHTTENQRHDYSEYLKLSIGAIKDLPIPSASEHVDALFAYHSTQYRVRLPSSSGECEWLRLLNDSLTCFSAPVIEVTCLECHPGNIICHHRPHHRYLTPGGRSPSTSSRSPAGGRSLSTHSTHSHISASSSSYHEHNPAGTVLQTTILLNPLAHLPAALRPFHQTGIITNEMLRAVVKGEILDLGDSGELRVLGHINVMTTPTGNNNTWYTYGRDSGSSLLLLEHGVVLVVERSRPDTRAPRTVRYFLDKVDDVIPAEFYHSELVHLDGNGGCEEDEDGDEGDEGRGGGRSESGLVHVLVVSDVHDCLIAEWMREFEFE